MEILGIKFAPLNLPLERRIQTFSLACWLIIFLVGILLSLFGSIYLVLFTKLRWLMLPYVIWSRTIDQSEITGRPNKWFRSWILWKHTRDYFPLRFVKLPTVELDPQRNYLFCVFPHGTFCFGACNAFGTEYSDFKKYFPHHQTRMATLNLHYQLPFFRELALSLGGIPANKESIHYVLSRPEGGHVCALIVGGVAESNKFSPGAYLIVVNRRKGFVKLALKNGAPLVPVISFGETNIYRKIDTSCVRYILNLLKKWTGKELMWPMGRGFFQYTFGMLPQRVPITTVVGNPVDVPKIEAPTTEQIEEYHQKFVRALLDLFEEQKHNYVDKPEETFLQIVG